MPSAKNLAGGYDAQQAERDAFAARIERLEAALELLDSKARFAGDCLGNSTPQFAACQSTFYNLASLASAALKGAA